eukprot:CAMPEP_0178985910 /NCGR_PEP_ID=MMETSP0795-20121207/2413_1 /TAXON_ID=88552 /ORGANISM="Amoebophrya sp., Strain Ameob2" /LENGTH=251 /DNA_ID=CAMNT_0020676917 /DNA_START=56 /DNA_END=808 /DNA_ORIENTATION=-
MSDDEKSGRMSQSSSINLTSDSDCEVVKQTIDETSRLLSDTNGEEGGEQINHGPADGNPNSGPANGDEEEADDDSLGDFFLEKPAIIADRGDSIFDIVQKAHQTLIDAGGRLATIFSQAIESSTIPMFQRHPVTKVMQALEQHATPLEKKPTKALERWRAESFAATVTHACLLCVRYADRQGEELTKGVTCNQARVLIHQFMKMLDDCGSDFVRVVRQMLVLVWTFGVSTTNSKGKVHPLVVALFSGAHYF